MRTLDRMEQSDVLHRQIVETSLEGIWVIDAEGNTTFANRQMAEMLRTTPGDMLGKRLAEDFMDREGRAISERNLQQRREGIAEQLEFKLIRTDGTELWALISTNPLTDSEGKVTGSLSMVTDISDLRAARQDLERREAIHRGAVRCARGVPYETRVEPGERVGRYVFMDPAIEELTGVPHADFTPSKMKAVTEELRVTGEGAPGDFDDYCQEVVDGKRDRYTADLRIRTPQGETKWLSDCSVIVRDDATGEIVGCLGILQDVTARHRVEEERRALQAQVLESRRHEALSILAGGIAQDFNNLLLGILGNVELMVEDLPPDSDLRPMLDDVHIGAQRVADLTSQMLSYAGKSAFVAEPLSLPTMLENLRDALAPHLRNGKELVLDLDPGTPAVRGDHAQMRHVLFSLVMNGIEALAQSRGSVKVRTRSIHATRQTMNERAKGTEVPVGPCAVIEVIDTGMGMDDETRERVFDPFFSTKMSGRGLGLAATLGIVRRHRGCIGVTSAPGKGTTVRVLLPAERSPAV
jgi:PAS domain S-box-containing protein